MNPLYPAVAVRAAHRCEYCRAPEAIFNFRFEVEHIKPVAKGGENDLTNLALACRSCNLGKSSNTDASDPSTGNQVGLFHPREQHWNEHFIVVEDMRLQGVTATGRATTALLRMDTPLQCAARTLWMQLGLFP